MALVEKYAKAQDMFWTPKAEEPVFSDTLQLDLATVVPSMAGPKRARRTAWNWAMPPLDSPR